MKHAGEEALDNLESLLVALRGLPGLQERKRGVFYRRSKAFLHFHEDPTGLYADLRLGEEFNRVQVTTGAERAAFMKHVRKAL